MLRRFAIVSASLLGAVLLLFVAAFGYAQTRMAKDQIGGLIESQLSSETQKAEVEQLGGLLPFDVRIGRFALADGGGTWLEVEDARVKVQPTALLAGRVHIQQAGARRVRIERLPPGGTEPAAQEETAGLPAPPELPAELPVFAVDRLYVDALELVEAVLGKAATFAIEGRAGTNEAGTAVDASLQLRRTDEGTAEVSLSAGADLAARTLRVDFSASETGGLVGAALGRPEAGATRLSLTGGGPLTDFRARLRGEIERLARLDADLALAWTDTPRVELAASLDAEPGALPEAYAELLGQRATVELAAGETAPGVFALDLFSVKAAAIEAGGSGRIAVDAGTIDGRVSATIADLSRASKIAGMPLAGSLDLVAEARQGEGRPAVSVRLQGQRLVFDTFGLGSLGADLTLAPSAPLAGGWQGADVAGTVRLRQAALDGEPLRPVPDLDITLDLGVPAEGAIAIRELEATGDHLALAGSGSFDPAALAGSLDLALDAPDLAGLLDALGPMRPEGLDLAGGAKLSADARIGEGFSAVEADLELATRDLSGLPPGAAELLGSDPTLAAEVRYAEGEPLAVRELALAGAEAKLSGAVTYGLADGALGGSLSLSLPRLAALEPVAGQPLSGAATLEVDLGGTVAAPEVKARLGATPFGVAGQAFDRVELAATAAGPVDSLSGDLSLVAVRGGQEAQLASAWRLAPDALELSGLALDAPATRLSGDVRVRFEGPRVDGQLAGAVEDLAALEPWTGQKLAGAVRLDARFETRDGAQGVALEAELSKLAGSFGGLYEASLAARVEDALGTPRVQAKLDAREFTQPGLRVKTASAELSGPVSDLVLAAAAEGEQQAQPFELRAEAAIAALDARKRLVLRKVEGSLGERQLRLRKPATAVLENGVLQIDELDLLLGEGEVRGGLRLDGRDVRGFAKVDRLPLGTLADLGGPAVAGEANLDLELAGPVRAPRLTVEGRLAGLRPADDLYGTLPAADLLFRGDAADGRFALAFEVAKLEGTTAKGRIEGPLTLRLEPFALALDPAGPLSGSVDARLELASLAAIAGLDAQKLEGPLAVALRISGTPAAPELSGTAHIDGARLADSITGVTLTGLVLRLEAEGERLRLVELRAGDGREGRLEATGELALGGASGLVYEGRLELDDFVVSDNPLVWAVADARLEAAGDARRGRVAGRIEVDRAEIGIPSGGGVDIPQLEVIEVGDGAPPWQPDFAVFRRPEGDPGYELALDVRVDMPARIFVRGRGLQSEWGGSLQIAGTASAPVVEGTIDFRRGYMDLLDRRFVIREGRIRFVGSSPPTPLITLVAAAEGDGMTAIVRLDGPATDPEVELDSDPALPKDEILARLLFGRDVSRITPVQGIRLAAAVRQLEGGGGLDVLAGLRETVGVDTLDVGGESPSEAYVSAGKYVAENVFVEVQQGLATGETKARVEVELTDNINVVTEAGDSTNGVEVEWRYDY